LGNACVALSQRSGDGFRADMGCDADTFTLESLKSEAVILEVHHMPNTGEVWVQLATRIPKNLHRELKLHCVKSEISVMEFVVKALQDKLGRETSRSERRRAR
jgi:hypothetical protein